VLCGVVWCCLPIFNHSQDTQSSYATPRCCALLRCTTPQDDLLNGQLTVEETLRYTARLRCPPTDSDAQRQAKLEQVCGGGGTGAPFLAASFAVPAAHMLALNMLAHFVAVLAMLAWLPPTAAPLSSTG
jgi:hypothetical protein